LSALVALLPENDTAPATLPGPKSGAPSSALPDTFVVPSVDGRTTNVFVEPATIFEERRSAASGPFSVVVLSEHAATASAATGKNHREVNFIVRLQVHVHRT